MKSSHTLDTVLKMGPTMPILLISVIVLAIGLMKIFFPLQLSKWGFSISSDNLKVDENLPDFFQALKIKDKNYFIAENEYSMEQYGFMVANPGTISEMKKEKYSSIQKNVITNIPFYWLIANPYYQRKFNYFPACLANREDYVVDEDSDEGNDCE